MTSTRSDSGTPAVATDDTVQSYTYTSMDRMATLLTTSHGRPVFSQDFVGTNPATGVYAATMDYESDGQRGGVFETRYNPDGSVLSRTAIDYTYDPLSRLTSTVTDSTVDTQDASESFTFDLASNRISSTRTGTNSGVTTYRYDARNRMVDQTNTPTGGTATVTANTFDAQGNQLTAGTDRYLYDSRGRLARAIIGGVTTRYDYDIAGERISQSRSATTTTTTTVFLSDKHNATGYPQVIEETTRTSAAGAFTTTLRSNTVGVRIEAQSDTTTTTTLTPPGTTTTTTTTGPLNLVRDAKGSVRTLLRPDGQQLERYDFTSFGEATLFQRIDPATSVVTTITVSQASTAQLFGGDAESDNATGLYFAGVRVRRAADGNWLSQDPSFFGPGALGDANLYSFVGGNPVSRWDPTGLWTLPQVLVGAALGAYVFSMMGVALLALSPSWRNTSFTSAAPGQFVPVTNAKLVGAYHAIKIRGSKLTADELFLAMSRMSERNKFPAQANGDITRVGDELSFDMVNSSLMGYARELGQGDFSVRVTQFDRVNRLFVVRTLSGHPLAGWRRWQVKTTPSGDIILETFSVEHTYSTVDSFKAWLGLQLAGDDMLKTWQNYLWDLHNLSGGTAIYDKDTNLGGSYYNNATAMANLPFVDK